MAKAEGILESETERREKAERLAADERRLKKEAEQEKLRREAALEAALQAEKNRLEREEREKIQAARQMARQQHDAATQLQARHRGVQASWLRPMPSHPTSPPPLPLP